MAMETREVLLTMHHALLRSLVAHSLIQYTGCQVGACDYLAGVCFEQNPEYYFVSKLARK